MLSLADDQIDINPEFRAAFRLIDEQKANVFITGRAGTGKSTFLRYCRARLSRRVVTLAPTGVAAVNVEGQTIHSFFRFRPDITVAAVRSLRIGPEARAIYRKLEVLILDEVSMVRADLLDCVDVFLRAHGPDPARPFGGVQVVLIGDLYQLPPVVRPDQRHIFQTAYASPYFFDAKVFQRTVLKVIEFKTHYRQQDPLFLDILNHIRSRRVSAAHLARLNQRCRPDFDPGEDFYVYLTTTNKLADQLNKERLQALASEEFIHEGQKRGDFANGSLPAQETLCLKPGAQVMLLNNDPQGRWVNGTMGEVTEIFQAGFNSVAVQVALTDGQRVEVEPFTWEVFQFFYDDKRDKIDTRVTGSFKQFPLKLAWAITIHKSQGQTFDRVVIDTGRGAFCHGQVYVALSRCTTLEGIVLKQRLGLRDIQLDPRIARFMRAAETVCQR